MQKSKLQIKNQNKNKKEEIECANFFIKRFNKKYNLNYQIIPNESVNSDTDVSAISNNNPKYNFQIITGEGPLKRICGSLKTRSKQTGQNIVMVDAAIDMNIEKWIQEAIEKKKNKKYSSAKHLILLICREIGPLFNTDYAKERFANFKNFNFKGIYIVHLPTTSETSSHPHNGQIIAIKDIFGNRGECF